MVPISQHAQALKVLFLPLDLLGSISPAQALGLFDRQVFAVQLFDFALDRHAVAVPARHVRGVKTRQHFALDDDVLENLIDRVPEVNITVRIRRAIVQDEFRSPLRSGADCFVHLFLLPLAHPVRLALGKIAAHRERRIGEIQGFLVISHGLPMNCPHALQSIRAYSRRLPRSGAAIFRRRRIFPRRGTCAENRP